MTKSIENKIPKGFRKHYKKGYGLCKKKIENNYNYNTVEYEKGFIPARNKCGKCDGKDKKCEDYKKWQKYPWIRMKKHIS